MARPHQSQHARKSRVVSFRLTDAEFTRLAHKAAAANLRIHDLARRLTLSNDSAVEVETIRRTDPMLISQLNRIGHNLNQLVKNAHIFGRVSPQIDALCRKIDHIIDEAVQGEIR